VKADNGHWFIKVLLFAALLAGAWFMPIPFYDGMSTVTYIRRKRVDDVVCDAGYVHVARIVSGIFLIIQIAILIDFACSWVS
jgi:hypothetical protein